jgi:hypothetical protein
VSRWRPIETAPTDGRSILVYGFRESELHAQEDEPGIYMVEADGRPEYMSIIGTCYYSAWVYKATHWMPLPKAPE